MWLHLASLTAACRPPVSETRFARLAAAAISTGRPLRLTNRSVQLHAPFRLRSSQRLTIVGGDFHGDGHSLFQVEGSRQGLLDLRGVRLLHASSAERSERRESVAARKRPLHVASAGFKPPRRARGAAIFVRGKGQLALERCELSSETGFGLWLVQRARAAARDSHFHGGRRSSIVAFEQASHASGGGARAQAWGGVRLPSLRRQAWTCSARA